VSYIVSDEKARELGLPEKEQVLVALTVDDLIDAADRLLENGWKGLADKEKSELIIRASNYLVNFLSEGTYTWQDALEDAVLDLIDEAD
jgi:hypothetical protein